MQTEDTNYCEVSIIIPVYNGSSLLEKHLTPFLAWLKARSYSTQVILVDDGSPDQLLTAAYARKHNLTFRALARNKGKGAALREGFGHANGAIRLFTDADIPFQYRNIEDLISSLQKDPGQLIIGDRTAPSSDYFEKASNLRNWGSNLVSTLVNLFFVKHVRDTQCGLKGMGKEVARQLFNDSRIERFAIDIELIYLARKKDIPIVRIPVQLRYNDKSSIKVAKDGLRLLWDIYRIKKIHGKYR